MALIAIAGTAIAAPAIAKEAKCSLHSPRLEQKKPKVILSIELDCATGKTNYPADQKLLAGLTVYSEPFEDDTSVRDANIRDFTKGKNRRLLGDDYADKFDFPVQAIRVKQGEKMRLRFEAPTGAIDNKIYWLFAIWPNSAKEQCEKGLGARPGCSAYGYVLGDSYGIDSVIDVYPGLAEVDFTDEDRTPLTLPRWIVEKIH
jgi:hypothetical protein